MSKGERDFAYDAPDPRVAPLRDVPPPPVRDSQRLVIFVNNGNLDAALKILKRGYLRDTAASLKRHRYFVPPGERRRIKARDARRKRQKRAKRETLGEEPAGLSAMQRLAEIDRWARAKVGG